MKFLNEETTPPEMELKQKPRPDAKSKVVAMRYPFGLAGLPSPDLASLTIPRFRQRPALLLLVVVMALGLAGSLPAPACQICFPVPKKSIADYLIEAETVVLAREDPERPFYFAPVATLKGYPGNEKIDLFLDSTTRRVLATYPRHSIVLARLTDGEKKSWRRIGTADQDLGPIVKGILAASVAWQKEPKQRIAFFAKLLGHDNSQVRLLAHLEIARAPYNEIRNCSGLLSREEIRAFLDDFQYADWHPLYILLLAQSDDPTDRELIRKSFESAARFGATLRTAAWATAFIETVEEKAVAEIEKRYFRNADRKPEELQAMLQALSVQGTNGHTHLRERIVAAYGVLLKIHPSMAPFVVRDLTAWKRTDFASEVAAYLAEKPRDLDALTISQLRAYVLLAEGIPGELKLPPVSREHPAFP